MCGSSLFSLLDAKVQPVKVGSTDANHFMHELMAETPRFEIRYCCRSALVRP